jgi:hypothetical protein
VAAFAPEHHGSIKQAMMAAFVAAGVHSRAWILPVDNQGSRVEAAKDDF